MSEEKENVLTSQSVDNMEVEVPKKTTAPNIEREDQKKPAELDDGPASSAIKEKDVAERIASNEEQNKEEEEGKRRRRARFYRFIHHICPVEKNLEYVIKN